MAGRWGALGQQSIGHGDKVRGRSVQGGVFYRSRGWRPQINTYQMRGSAPTLPPWPIDGAPSGSNLSAMAAKCGAEVCKLMRFIVRVNGDPPINACQMRGRTPTLPPWLIDGALRGSNLSAMAAKCGAEVSNPPQTAVKALIPGDPATRRCPAIHRAPDRIRPKRPKSITNRAILLHESWPELGWAGLPWPGLV